MFALKVLCYSWSAKYTSILSLTSVVWFLLISFSLFFFLPSALDSSFLPDSWSKQDS